MASSVVSVGRWGSTFTGIVDAVPGSVSGNTSRVRIRGVVYNGGTASSSWGSTPCSISGTNSWSQNRALSVAAKSSQTLFDVEFTVTHDSDGRKTVGYTIAFGPTGTQTFGQGGSVYVSLALPRIPKVPGKPPTPVLQSVEVNAILFSIAAPGDNGGSSITTYLHEAATDNGFSTIVQSWASGATNQSASPLSPGTTHWIRYRAVNSVGSGPWSDALSASTPAAVAPGLTVSPSLSGTSASLLLTPPPGGAPVTKYRVERRALGGSATPTDFTVTAPTVGSLSPGSIYEWRASAFYGDYQTPWSSWQAVIQPNPNVSPGDYFDGSTPPDGETTYSWMSTAHASMSFASVKRPKGWSVDPGPSGAAAGIYRTIGGRSGSHAATVLVLSSASAAGLHAGIEAVAPGAFEVEPGGGYPGLIHVQLPDRSQRIAAMLIWLDSDYDEIGRAVGEARVVSSSTTEWTPLRVSGVAPAGAAWGALRVIDVAGAGWSAWKAGDRFLLDDAISPFDAYYFDGDTMDAGDFTYEWEGAPGESPSIRVESTEPQPDPLADPNCPPVPAPPRAPTVEELCAVEPATQWRRIWVEVEKQNISTIAWSVPILRIRTTQSVNGIRIRYYQNPFGRPLSDLEVGDYCGEQMVSFLPAGVMLTIDGVMERVWAEFDGSPESLAADHLTSGDRSLMWPLLGCGVGYYVTADIPVDLPPEALSIEYSIIQRY